MDGGRGWIGDVKKMLLDIEKIKKLNWLPKLDSKEAVKRTIREILQNKLLQSNI